MDKFMHTIYTYVHVYIYSRCRHYKNSVVLSSSAALSMIQKQFCSHTLEQRQQRGRVAVSLSE